MKVPILINLYNRPNYTKKLFSLLKIIKPKKIYISIDGPKNEKDQKKVQEVFSIVKKINWKCQKIIKLNKYNIGCKNSISQAIDWFFAKEKYGIILEDDILPSKYFFIFCEIFLPKYKDNKKISMITGFNSININSNSEFITFFLSRHFPIWGWATWARAWKGYKKELSKKEISSYLKKNSFNSLLEKLYFHQKFLSHFTYWKNTWDIQWLFHCLKKKTYCLTPSLNLIENIDDNYFFKKKNTLKKLNQKKLKLLNNSKVLNKEYDDLLFSKYGYPHLFKTIMRNYAFIFKEKFL